MSPLWLVFDLLSDLNIEAIIHVDVVWGSLTMVEVGEGSVMVRVSRIMSPLWLILNLLVNLNIKSIIVINIVWASLSVIEVSEWTVVV